MRSHDWSLTPLGPPGNWPQSLRTVIRLMLNTGHPMYIFWGPEGACFYNDAYRPSIGAERHPGSLGRPAREVWDEIWPIIGPQIEQVMSGGGATWHENALVPITRDGVFHDVYWTYSYSPIDDENAPGGIGGVLVTCNETTAFVMAERDAEAGRLRQREMLRQMPGFAATMSGPNHVFDDANDAYIKLVGGRELLGLPVREAFPELEGQGFFELLDQVFSTGEPIVMRDREVRLTNHDEPQYLDFIYQPVRNPEGEVAGIFVGGYELTETHRAITALSESRQNLQRLTDNLPLLVAFVDRDLRYVFNNRTYEDWFGVTPEELRGRSVREVLGEDAFRLLEPHLKRVFAGERITIEQFIPYSRGGGRHTHVEYIPRRDDAGEVDGYYAMVQDVSARRQAELRQAVLLDLNDAVRDLVDPAEIAQASSRILAEALNVSRVGYGVMDTVAETITIERDYNAPGVKSIAGVIHFRDFGSYIEDLARGEAVIFADAAEDPRISDGGEALAGISATALINLPLIERGKVVALLFVNNATPRPWSEGDVALVREVAERVRMAAERARAIVALDQANETLSALLTGSKAERDQLWTLSQDMLARADYSGGMSAVSPAWTKVLGWTEEELLTNPYADIIHPDDVPATVAALEKMGETGQPTRFENLILSRTGEWTPIGWTVSPEDDGVNFIAVGRDLTADKVRERQLAQAQEALRQSQKMEAVGQLTGGIAHDFNNLLAGISGSLELLEKRMAEGRLAGVERYISAAQGAARRAASLTQRLLAFSRRQTLDPKPTDVNRLIAGMEELIRRSVGPDVKVEVVGAGGLWTTRVDPSQLENALLNLCINSRDAMAPDGGRLTIETANKWLDERAAAERDLPPGQYISLCVTDTGCGMSPEVQAQAFDPFFTTKPLGQGTGLGLSMIHGFVRQSGGQVRIYSEVGRGATMCLYLPRHNGEVEVEAPQHGLAAEGGQGETVLVVDDEPTVRMLVKEVLEEAGYIVMEASDGPAGLAILRSDARVDLLISDVGLPGGMNGRQVADAARDTRPELKVLFITGYAENAAVGNGHLDPGMEVITKPFAMAVLGAKVREMIEG